MASATWTQGRVRNMLRHTYTRQTLVQAAAPNDEDLWGQPSTDYATMAQVLNVPCLFLDESTYILGPAGSIQVEENSLCIAADDPLGLDDQILNVTDPVTGKVLYVGPGTVQNFTDIASHGYLLYRYARLYAGEAT